MYRVRDRSGMADPREAIRADSPTAPDRPKEGRRGHPQKKKSKIG